MKQKFTDHDYKDDNTVVSVTGQCPARWEAWAGIPVAASRPGGSSTYLAENRINAGEKPAWFSAQKMSGWKVAKGGLRAGMQVYVQESESE